MFNMEETLPTPPSWPCSHCGRTMGDAAGGFASYNGLYLCYPSDEARPNCYRLVAMEHHHIPCDEEGCWVGDHEGPDPV